MTTDQAIPTETTIDDEAATSYKDTTTPEVVSLLASRLIQIAASQARLKDTKTNIARMEQAAHRLRGSLYSRYRLGHRVAFAINECSVLMFERKATVSESVFEIIELVPVLTTEIEE